MNMTADSSAKKVCNVADCIHNALLRLGREVQCNFCSLLQDQQIAELIARCRKLEDLLENANSRTSELSTISQPRNPTASPTYAQLTTATAHTAESVEAAGSGVAEAVVDGEPAAASEPAAVASTEVSAGGEGCGGGVLRAGMAREG